MNPRSLTQSDSESILSACWNKKLTFYCIGSNTLYTNIFEIILHFEKKPKLRILESGFILLLIKFYMLCSQYTKSQHIIRFLWVS